MALTPKARAGSYLALSQLALLCMVCAMWCVALRAPVALAPMFLGAGTGASIVARGWVSDRSTANRDAIEKLGWSSRSSAVISTVQWVWFGLFLAALVYALTLR